MAISGVSAPDPFIISDKLAIGGGNPLTRYYISGRTPVSKVLAAERTAVLIGGPSQSNQSNTIVTSSYTVSQAKNHNFCIDNGGLYSSVDPLLGCTDATANHFTRLGDKIIADGYVARSILAPMAFNGSRSSEWAAGGICNPMIKAMIRRLNSAGLLSATFVFALMQLGETDNLVGTSGATFTANVRSAISTMQAEMTAAGFPNKLKVFVAQTTWLNGVTSAAIRTAQAGLVDNVTYFSGPDTDTLDNTNRDATFAHWNDTGGTAVRNLWATKIEAQMP